jgi:hypothetical protein
MVTMSDMHRTLPTLAAMSTHTAPTAHGDRSFGQA